MNEQQNLAEDRLRDLVPTARFFIIFVQDRSQFSTMKHVVGLQFQKSQHTAFGALSPAAGKL